MKRRIDILKYACITDSGVSRKRVEVARGQEKGIRYSKKFQFYEFVGALGVLKGYIGFLSEKTAFLPTHCTPMVADIVIIWGKK